MQVFLNPCINKYNNSFYSNKNKVKKTETSYLSKAEQDAKEIQKNRVKTAVRLCLAAVIGLDIIYFAAKRRLKGNHEMLIRKKLSEKAKLIPPEVNRPPVENWQAILRQ